MSWKRTVYAVYIAQTLSIMGFSCVMPFLPYYIRELGVSGETDVIKWAGWIATVSAVTFALFSPIWGALADRFGRKPMVLRSMFSGVVVLLLMSWVRNVHELAVCRVIQGALTGTITACVALVASVAPRERSGFAIGLIQGAVYLGAAIGPFVGGVMADHMGLRATFRAAALILLAAGFLVHFAVDEVRSVSKGAEKQDRGSFLQVFSAVGFVAAAFALFTVRFANSAPAPVFPLFVEKLHGNSENINTVTGSLAAVGGVAAAVAAIILGRISDSWGQKKLLMLGCLFTGVIAMLHALARNVGQLFALRFMIGLGEASVIPSANALIRGAIQEKNLGKAYGATSMFTSMGWALGPLAGAQLAASMGLRAPFVLMGLIQGLTVLLVKWLIRPDTERAMAPPEARSLQNEEE